MGARAGGSVGYDYQSANLGRLPILQLHTYAFMENGNHGGLARLLLYAMPAVVVVVGWSDHRFLRRQQL